LRWAGARPRQDKRSREGGRRPFRGSSAPESSISVRASSGSDNPSCLTFLDSLFFGLHEGLQEGPAQTLPVVSIIRRPGQVPGCHQPFFAGVHCAGRSGMFRPIPGLCLITALACLVSRPGSGFAQSTPDAANSPTASSAQDLTPQEAVVGPYASPPEADNP